MANDSQVQNFPDLTPVVLTTYIDKASGEKEVIPLRCKKNTDGTWSLDITATLDPGQVTIGNVRIQDNDDPNILQDVVIEADDVETYPAGIYILGRDENNKNRLLNLQQIDSRYHLLCYSALKNKAGIRINPATEDTLILAQNLLDAINVKLGGVLSVDVNNWISQIGVNNFPSDYPDALAQTILDSIYTALTGTLKVKDRPDSNIIAYNNMLAVAPGVQTTLLTYTNSGSKFWLDLVLATGTYHGIYILIIDGNTIYQERTTAANINHRQPFAFPLVINTGSTIEIDVIHSAGGNRAFNASFIGNR